MKWSYTVETHPIEGIGQHLAARGREGWELCGVRDLGAHTTVELYFKRPDAVCQHLRTTTDNATSARFCNDCGAILSRGQ
jgi:hypothetical protein